MATIGKEAVRAAFDVAKRIREGRLSGSQGLTILEKNYGFNKNSAETYIHDYDCMAKGQLFTRTLNAFATKYYLTRFLADGGPNALMRALSALQQHIHYYESTSKTKLLKVRAIYDEFTDIAKNAPRHFLQYWKPKQVDHEIALSQTLDHSGSEQLYRIAPGNIVWIVTVREGQLNLVGRLVVGEITNYEEAKNRFGSNVWEASHHAIAKPGTGEPINELSLMGIAENLRFVSKTRRDRLKIVSGKVDGKQLQTIRELTLPSVTLIDRLWNRVGQAIDFERQVRRGVGFGNPETNKKVERAAIERVTEDYVSRGWSNPLKLTSAAMTYIARKGERKSTLRLRAFKAQ